MNTLQHAPSAANVTVRRALPSDITTFPTMKVRTWAETYRAFGIPESFLYEPPLEPEFAAGFIARIEDPDRNTWIAFDEVNQAVIGYATAVAKPNKHGYIDVRALYVYTEYQGLGVGRRLLEGVVGEGGKDCRAVVGTLKVNLKARAFYEKMGFTRFVGEDSGSMGGVDTPGVILARDAGGPETPLALIHEKDGLIS